MASPAAVLDSSCRSKPRGPGRSPSANSQGRASTRSPSATSTSSGDTHSHSHTPERGGAAHPPLKAPLPLPPPPPVHAAPASISATAPPAPNALKRSMSQQERKGQQGSTASAPPPQSTSGLESESSGRRGAAGRQLSDAASLERNHSSVTAASAPTPTPTAAAGTGTPATTGSTSGTPSSASPGQAPGSELKSSSLGTTRGPPKAASGAASDGFKVPSLSSQTGDTPAASRMPHAGSASSRAPARPSQQQHMPRSQQQKQQQPQGLQQQQGSKGQAGGVPAHGEALLKQIQELTGILTEAQAGTGKMQTLASAAAAASAGAGTSQQPFAGAASPSSRGGGRSAPGSGGGAGAGEQGIGAESRSRESEQQSFDLLCSLLPLLASASGTPGVLLGGGAQGRTGASAGGSGGQGERQDQMLTAGNQGPPGASPSLPGAGPAPSALDALINALTAAASSGPQPQKPQLQGGPSRGFTAPAQTFGEGAGRGPQPSGPSVALASTPPVPSFSVPSLPSFTVQPGSHPPSSHQLQGSTPYSMPSRPTANLPAPPRQPGAAPPKGGGAPQPSPSGRSSDQAQVLAGKRMQGGAGGGAAAEAQQIGGPGGGPSSFSSASFDVLKRELERLLAEQHLKVEAHQQRQQGQHQHGQQAHGQGQGQPGMGRPGPAGGAGGPVAAPQRQHAPVPMQQDLQRLHDQLQQHLRLQQQQQQQQQQGMQHRRAPLAQGVWPRGGQIAGSLLSSSEEEEASSQVQPPTPGSSACSPSGVAHSTFSRQQGVGQQQGPHPQYQPQEQLPYQQTQVQQQQQQYYQQPHHLQQQQQQQQQQQLQQHQHQQQRQTHQHPQQQQYQQHQQRGGLVKPSALRLPSVHQLQGPTQQQQLQPQPGSVQDALAASHPQSGTAAGGKEAAGALGPHAGSAPQACRSTGGSWAPWAAAFRASGREPPSLTPAALQGPGEGGALAGGVEGASKSCLSSPLGSSSDFDGSLTQMSTPLEEKSAVGRGGQLGAGGIGGEGAGAQGVRLNPPHSQRSLPAPGAPHHPLQQEMGGPGGGALMSQSSLVHPLSPLAASLAASAPISPTTPSTRTPGVLDDGYAWRKYGQKPAKGAHFPRSYYRCAVWDCPARKTVELAEDGESTEIVYKEEHNHPQSVRTGPRFGGVALGGRPGRQGADRVMMTEDMVGALEQELHGVGGEGGAGGGSRAPGAPGERAWELEVLAAEGEGAGIGAGKASKFQRGQLQAEGGEGSGGARAVIKRPCSPLLVGDGVTGKEGAVRGADGRSPWDIPLPEEDSSALLPLGGEGGKPGDVPVSPGRKRKLTQREGGEGGAEGDGAGGSGAVLGRERAGSPKLGSNQGTSSCVTCLPVKTSVRVEAPRDELDDGFKWRKYGEKAIKHSPYKRNYYRCSKDGCSVKRVIERLQEDPKFLQVTYEGEHNHARPIVARIVHSQGQIRVQGMLPGGPANPGGVPGASPPQSPTSLGMGGAAGALGAGTGSLTANPLSLPPAAPLAALEAAGAAASAAAHGRGQAPAPGPGAGATAAPLSGQGPGAPVAGPPTARQSGPSLAAGGGSALSGRGVGGGGGAAAAAAGGAAGPGGASGHGAHIPNSASLDIGDVEVSFLREIEQKMDEYLPPLA